jgi:hypothetical protein
MKRQFKLVAERNVEFSILRKKSTTDYLRSDSESKMVWEEDLFETKKQIREISKSLPTGPGLLVITRKNDEILKITSSSDNIRDRFLRLKSDEEFEALISLMRLESIRSIKICYAREIRA